MICLGKAEIFLYLLHKLFEAKSKITSTILYRLNLVSSQAEVEVIVLPGLRPEVDALFKHSGGDLYSTGTGNTDKIILSVSVMIAYNRKEKMISLCQSGVCVFLSLNCNVLSSRMSFSVFMTILN